MFTLTKLALFATVAVSIAQAEPTPTRGDLEARTFDLGGFKWPWSDDKGKDDKGKGDDYGKGKGDDYGKGKGDDKCKKTEFWYNPKSCCLPQGGPVKKPSPPTGSQCPSTHYWHYGQGCCVPSYPNPPPKPECPPKWGWESSRQCCTPEKPTPKPPKPSHKPKPWGDKGHGHGDNGHGYGHGDKDHGDKDHGDKDHGDKGYGGYHRGKRAIQWDATFCPSGLTTCPVIVKGIVTGDSECVDTLADITSCGGCASLNRGTDCSKIPHAKSAFCQGGECVVEKCAHGFRTSYDESHCVPV